MRKVAAGYRYNTHSCKMCIVALHSDSVVTTLVVEPSIQHVELEVNDKTERNFAMRTESGFEFRF